MQQTPQPLQGAPTDGLVGASVRSMMTLGMPDHLRFGVGAIGR